MSEQYQAYSYDTPQIDEQLATASVDKLKVCDACGKPFLPMGRNASRMRYCQRQHYIKCAICGNTRDITLTKGFIASTCSKKCGDIYRGQQTQSAVFNKYGVTNVSQIPEIKEKAKASNALHKEETMAKIHKTMIERYGAAIPRQVPKLREKIDKTMVERYGVVNPSHSKLIREKISRVNSSDEVKAKYRTTSLANHGTEYPAQNPNSPNAWGNIKDKFETTMVDKYGVPTPFMSEACKKKARQTCLSRYGYEYVSQSPEIHQKMWNTRKNLHGVDGTHLDSTWEVIVYDFWKSLNLVVERNIPIEYEYNGIKHMTFVDFKVNDVLYEVKGNHFLNGSCEENKNVPMIVKLDVYHRNNVVIIADNPNIDTFNNGNLTSIDLALFKDIPDFPYDNKTRWTIIEYLVKHKEGFISLEDFQ